MHYFKNSFFISLGSAIWIAFVLWITQGFWLDNELIFAEHSLKWILISVFWLFLWAIWSTKETNTQWLKKILIVIEIYLFLLIFIQSGSNFSQGEFLLLYLSGVGICYEALYPRWEKWKKWVLVTIYSLVIFFIISIATLVHWRNPLDEQEFTKQQNYYLYLLVEDIPPHRSYSISLDENSSIKHFQLNTWIQKHLLDKDSTFSLLFSSYLSTWNQRLLIQDPSWNLLALFPQSKLTFSTFGNHLTYTTQWGKTERYDKDEVFSGSFSSFQKNYQELKEHFVHSKFPSWFISNPKLQVLSWHFTQGLWKVFPFRYGNEAKNSITFLPYLHFSELIKNYPRSSQGILDVTRNEVWQEKISWRSSYYKFLKELF